MSNYIPVNQPLLNGNEKKYLTECIDTGWISSEGPFIDKFEKTFAEYVDRAFGIAVCNGTVALEVAVKALGIGPGDEVILPSFTIISCAAAIVRAGAIPVLVDSDPETWNMNTARIEEKITSKTKAIMVVHIYGLPTDMDPVLALAKKYDLKIIEDAAEMHGQTYDGKKCGSFGDVSVFSFYPNKHITTGEGGMVVTSDPEIASKCKAYRNLCFIPERRFVHHELGWNFRMTNLQAALGLAQFEQLPLFIEKKRNMGRMYNELLQGLTDVQLPVMKTAYSENIFWVFGLVLGDSIPFNAAEMMKKLHEKGIGTRPFFYPMHQQPVFNNAGLFINEEYPVAARIAERGFYIPSGLSLTNEEIIQVAETVKSILR